MGVIFVLLAILFVILVSVFMPKAKSVPDEPDEPAAPIDRIFPKSTTACFRIAGISHHCSRRDIGAISGELIDEPNNPHDRNAVMIIDADTTMLLGYIAKEEKKEYRKIADGKARMPFVGFIEQYENCDGEMCLYGIVRTYAGDEVTVMSDAQNDWDFIQGAFTIKSYEERIRMLDQLKWEKH